MYGNGPVFYAIIRSMPIFSEHELGKLLYSLGKPLPDYILVGEVHGSRENAPLVRRMVEQLTECTPHISIAFEWTITDVELSRLQEYIAGGPIPKHLPRFFLDSDGRFTLEHATLLKWIREQNKGRHFPIGIYAFDSAKGARVAVAEQCLADSLLEYKTKQQRKTVVVVETGAIHARMESYSLEGTHCSPMGSILKERYRVCSIFLRYHSGHISAEGIMRDVTRTWSQQQGSGSFFNAIVEVPVSTGSRNIHSLTEIADLL